MAFKNLRSPARNHVDPGKESIAPIPVTPDPRTNDEPVNTTRDGEPPIRWPAPDNGARPMKNMK